MISARWYFLFFLPQHLRIRLHKCESSESEHGEDDDGEDFSSSSDDGGWMLETDISKFQEFPISETIISYK